MKLINPVGLPTKMRAGTIATAVAGLVVMLSAVGNFGLTGHAAAMPICESSGIPILVTIEKVRNSNGTIKVELYSGDGKKELKKSKKIARTRVKAQRGETKLCLNAPSVGNYAIALYHDENNNKKLDRNFIGIPREGFGFSNNPPVRLGMPAQKEVRFKVEPIAINLRISVVYL
jgi:uncharacterized protein (DUF2141 family)